MRIGETASDRLRGLLRGPGLDLDIRPFVIRLRSPVFGMAEAIARLYPDHALAEGAFADFHVAVTPSGFLARLFPRRIRFVSEGQSSFHPLPMNQAFPAFEWGLNWCVVSHINTYLLIHSGVLARDDRVVLLPGEPAAGKSTLTAGLMLRGWRLFSDELALVEPGTNRLRPMVRPVNLKNDSIRIIRQFAADAVLNAETPDTSKGVVSHLRPTKASVDLGDRPGQAAWVVFPRFTRGLAAPRITRVSRPQAFMRLADLSFNYATLGLAGFATLRAVVQGADCYDLAFGSLDDGMAGIERIAGGEATAA